MSVKTESRHGFSMAWIIAIITALLAAALAGFILADKGYISLPSAGSGSGQGSSSSGLVVQVPDGPKIKMVVSGLPEGLTLSWQAPPEVDELSQLKLAGVFQNNSGQKIENISMMFLLDGKRVGQWPAYGALPFLDPGQSFQFKKGIFIMPETLNKGKILEAVVSAETTPVATAAPTIKNPTPSPNPSPNSTDKVFTQAPANPQTPEEVVAAFAFLSDQKAYSSLEGMYTEKFLKEYGSLKSFWDYIAKGRTLNKVEVLKVREREARGDADLDVIFHFTNDGKFDSNPWLIKEDGRWKMKD